ncbi:hypothetical protein [Streptomyces cyaneochromogenes]|nr:hypothetical protein [Streptomyces cyaneochromogenes]
MRRSVVLPGATVPVGADIDSAVVLENGAVQHVPHDDVSDPEPAKETHP